MGYPLPLESSVKQCVITSTQRFVSFLGTKRIGKTKKQKPKNKKEQKKTENRKRKQSKQRERGANPQNTGSSEDLYVLVKKDITYLYIKNIEPDTGGEEVTKNSKWLFVPSSYIISIRCI